jgi:hypothetical protein
MTNGLTKELFGVIKKSNNFETQARDQEHNSFLEKQRISRPRLPKIQFSTKVQNCKLKAYNPIQITISM